MLGYLPFMEGYSIVELLPPKPFLGKTLKELDLINRFAIQVLAVKEGNSRQVRFFDRRKNLL
jgi:trk system potassium uptake protein TrkA